MIRFPRNLEEKTYDVSFSAFFVKTVLYNISGPLIVDRELTAKPFV